MTHLALLALATVLSTAPRELAVQAGPPLPQTQSWLDEPAAAATPAKRSGWAFGLLALVTCGGCVGALVAWRKRGRFLASTAQTEKIALLAVRSLGQRQRLCLVEVCGERLLLGASDQDITLLSHLPQADAATTQPPVFALTDAQAPSIGAAARQHETQTHASDESVALPDDAVEDLAQAIAAQTSAVVSKPTEPVATMPPARPRAVSHDVDGLRAWRLAAPAARTSQRHAP